MRKKISDTTFLLRLSNQHKERLDTLSNQMGIARVDVIRNLLDLATIKPQLSLESTKPATSAQPQTA
jgi:hypothetical protein